MPPTTEISSPTPPTQGDEFDPVFLWIRYKSRIMLFLAMVLVAGALSLLYWRLQELSRANARKALAEATTPEALQKVAADHPRNVVAGDALLKLADRQREDGKLDDSNATLREMIAKHSSHPLISGAYTSLASNLEAQGKADEALLNYKNVIASYPLSFSAPVAYIGEGRILQAKGNAEEARRAYESVVTQFPESPFQQEALGELQKLKK